MKTETFFFASDAINRYGYIIDIQAFERLIKDVHKGGIPMLIAHDFHKPIGWNLPFGVYIKPGIAFASAIRSIAENELEQTVITGKTNQFLNERYQNTFLPVKESFLDSLSSEIQEDSLKIDCGCAAIVQTNIAFDEFKDFFEGATFDKNGLMPLQYLLTEFDYYKQGIFKHKKRPLCLFAHPYFRRSQSRLNNFFFTFLDELVSLTTNTNVTIRIRIDPDMIGYSPSCVEMGELAYHYGPKYNDQVEQIKHGISRHQSTDLDRKFSGISATEFYGKHDGNEFTFEVEEIKDHPAGSTEEHYACRYVHAIYDKQAVSFHHFDGAIRSYNFESIIERVSQSFIEAGRKAEYTKLFRLDGKLPVSLWKSLVTNYYQENPLIYEYFDIDISHLKPQSSKKTEPVTKVLPYDMTMKEGVRIFLSYHEITKPLEQGRYVDIFDVIGDENGKNYFVEHNVFELKFALAKLGEDLAISENVDIMKFDDDLWNIPSIMHTGENAPDLLIKTIEAICNLFTAMIMRASRKTVSLTLSYVVNNRIVRISSFGRIQDQLNWLRSLKNIPLTEDDLTNWVTTQSQYIKQFSPEDDNDIDEALLQQDGVLYIKRVQVKTGFQIKPNESGGYSIFLSEAGTPKDIMDMCSQKQIRPNIAFKIDNAVWEDTGENYFTSYRSKWMDKLTCNLFIKECSPVAVFWAKQD